MPENDNKAQSLPFVKAPDFQPTAGFAERMWTGAVQAVKSGFGMALIGAAGGAAIGAVTGAIADNYLPRGEELKGALNAGAERASPTFVGPHQLLPTTSTEAIAEVTSKVLGESKVLDLHLSGDQTSKLIDYAVQARENIGPGHLAQHMALTGAETAGVGGLLYGAAKGALWTDRIKQERELQAVLDAQGQSRT